MKEVMQKKWLLGNFWFCIVEFIRLFMAIISTFIAQTIFFFKE